MALSQASALIKHLCFFFQYQEGLIHLIFESQNKEQNRGVAWDFEGERTRRMFRAPKEGRVGDMLPQKKN